MVAPPQAAFRCRTPSRRTAWVEVSNYDRPRRLQLNYASALTLGGAMENRGSYFPTLGGSRRGVAVRAAKPGQPAPSPTGRSDWAALCLAEGFGSTIGR